MKTRLQFQIANQPDDTTCGPTCLHAIYQYYGDLIPLQRVVEEVRSLDEGGTLAVFLACHAINRGYRVCIYTYNLQLFDPTWFQSRRINLADRLRRQSREKNDPKLALSTQAYLEFLENGGEIRFQSLSSVLLRRFLNRSIPILTGLSATYLYKSARECGPTNEPDDIRGEPAGHFVILCGYDQRTGKIDVADPYRLNPLSGDSYYRVRVNRLIHSILLGIVTYDANLVVIEPGVQLAARG